MTTIQSTLDALWAHLIEEPNDYERLRKWIDANEKAFGENGAQAALRRAAERPDSWLAMIWMTRPMLEDGKIEESIELYRAALELAPRKSLAVQEISGHLGEAGYYWESIDLLLPIYSAENHGPWAGFNLFNACEDVHHLDGAQEVLNRMKKADWPDEPASGSLKQIVRIRQEKLDILYDMRKDAGSRFH